MPDPSSSSNFFVVGGTLKREAASYVRRPVDDEILQLTLSGEYCNVLAARQTGKSSLMVRTSECLKEQGVRTVIIDLTSIGSNVSQSEWFFGLLSRFKRDLNLSVDENAWWQARSEQSPVQRFSDFLREVILEEISDPIVVFVDEIDSTLKLGFTDDFFAAIRATYNARSNDPAYERLTFVLLGVARPADLIKDRTRTPYNIGAIVDVTDFQFFELGAFESALEQACPGQGGQILSWALEWTGGQPYLSQKLCAEVVEQAGGKYSEERLAAVVTQLFLGDKARTETNLRSIRDRVSENPHAPKMLHIYKRVLTGKQVEAEERSIEQNELKLAGLVKVSSKGFLQVRNRIYASVFDAAWVKANTPVSTTQRVSVIASVIAVIAIGVAGYFFYRQRTQAAEIQAATYVESFNTSQSAEVRITNLAGLFELGDQYADQGRELFKGLSHAEQLALFELGTPENVGNELLVVVENTYQEQRNTPEGNEVLQTMSGILEQTSSPAATGLILEINTWLDGRDQAGQEQYETAITFYTNAWERSQERNQKNPGVLYDRGVAYSATEQFDLALKDFDQVLGMDAARTVEVESVVLGDQALADLLRENSSDHPNLASAITIPEVIPTQPSPTPAATATPALEIGSTSVSEKDGMVMVYVPAGEFEMGSSDDEIDKIMAECEKTNIGCQLDWFEDQQPAHTIYLDAFWIDQTEVTNAMYSKCVETGNCDQPRKTDYLFDPNYADYPIRYLTWDKADAYCTWAGRRLPTEAEWEKAAGWDEVKQKKNIYPWGDEFICQFAAMRCGAAEMTSVVGSYESGQSPYGVYDMVGNEKEWVADWYDSGYYAISPYSNPLGPGSGNAHIARGFGGNLFESRISQREFYNEGGFRCARNATP